MVTIQYANKFQKLYKKLPPNIKDAVKTKGAIFADNPYQSSLDTHKLGGKLKQYWSFSVGYNYRIIFSFLTSDTVRFYVVGTHSIYSRFHGE